jgi:hypothetical protein
MLPYTPSLEDKFHDLTLPFPPARRLWRTVRKSEDGKRALLTPYISTNALADRLDEVFPQEWTAKYNIHSVAPVHRSLPADTTNSAKLIVLATLVIAGTVRRSSLGEAWADGDNAAARAQNQAFLRACFFLGMGRYLLRVPPAWADIDGAGKPLHPPSLPAWALPPSMARKVTPKPATSPVTSSVPVPFPLERVPSSNSSPTDTVRKVHTMLEEVGPEIAREFLARQGKVHGQLSAAEILLQPQVIEDLDTLLQSVRYVKEISSHLRKETVHKVLESNGVSSLAQIPSCQVLQQLVRGLNAAYMDKPPIDSIM